MSDLERYPAYYGVEETLISAMQHLGSFIEYAKGCGIPLTLPASDDEAQEHGYAILEHALACVESLYSAWEDGLVIETDGRGMPLVEGLEHSAGLPEPATRASLGLDETEVEF